jgi:hypothetical protein
MQAVYSLETLVNHSLDCSVTSQLSLAMRICEIRDFLTVDVDVKASVLCFVTRPIINAPLSLKVLILIIEARL